MVKPVDARVVRATGERRLGAERRRLPNGRRLYVWASVVTLAFVFWGFARTFYLRGAFGSPELSSLELAHGIVMTSWFTLFLVQVLLVATRNVKAHRRLGVAGIALGIAVIIMGTELGIASARSGFTPDPKVSPLVFLLMPLGEMIVFGTLFTAAILFRNRSAYHKRLMLVATVGMLTPAMARIPVHVIQMGGPPLFFSMTDALVFVCILIDTLKNRKLHPAFAAGFVFIVAGQLLRLALSMMPQWVTFARWLAG